MNHICTMTIAEANREAEKIDRKKMDEVYFGLIRRANEENRKMVDDIYRSDVMFWYNGMWTKGTPG